MIQLFMGMPRSHYPSDSSVSNAQTVVLQTNKYKYNYTMLHKNVTFIFNYNFG